ncbi:MAG TPA: hypothetical protein DCL54_11770 [Alphaproteobacteria bacterium]|nr:hypothetical protein [Alphaproteobacteria bacterium]
MALAFRGLVALALGLGLTTAAMAQDAAVEMAAEAPEEVPVKAAGKSGLARVLSPSDFAAYKQLFKQASDGDLAGVEAGLSALKNKTLAGHVWARAYLAPKSTTSFEQLQGWLQKYANYPEAAQIYKLAQSKGSGPLNDPERRIIRGGTEDGPDMTSDIETSAGSAAARKVRSFLKAGQAGEAQQYLLGEGTSALGPKDYNQLLAEVAGGLYYSGRDQAAYQLAAKAAAERDHAPLADWIAGLSAWRLQDYASAAKHFDYMANQPDMTSWLKSAAGFWGARASIAARQPHRARALLEIAASKPRTFYGLMAMRILGQRAPFTWTEPTLEARSFQRVSKVSGVARAVALAQLGMRGLAEDVMMRAHGKLDHSLDGPFIALAGDLGFASVQFFAASAARTQDLKANAFPILPMQPRGGFAVDPALIHAIVRQESRFETDAESPSGARGLMQVLPSTAKLGDDPRKRLFEPVYNLTVGQNYVREMMRFTSPDGNLLQTLVAYNGGPGNLQKWLASVDYRDDPLLFIESLPSRETRGYVERVMANMWIYQMRMGKPTTSLDDLASGRWPIYSGSAKRVASAE